MTEVQHISDLRCGLQIRSTCKLYSPAQDTKNVGKDMDLSTGNKKMKDPADRVLGISIARVDA